MNDILVDEKGESVHITLNRPQTLNALNHQMVFEITRLLDVYKIRDDIENIIFRGAGDRAFCAGGDIKSVYFDAQDDVEKGFQYFADEYAMNQVMHTYPKPIISFCHGYVMGGGYGIAGNGSHVVVRADTKFAMPEAGIGFFPDVGIGWKLAKLGAMGMYIALTGNVLNADEMVSVGLATGKVGDDDFERGVFNNPLPVTAIANHELIEELFSEDTLEDIFHALENDNSDIAQETLKILQSKSPISLHITFHHLKKSRHETYTQSIVRDYQLACACLSQHDFYEGVRAAVVDKDRNPKWASSSIFNISQADIDYYFRFSHDDG
jgi:enoyl-CoA hydratase